MNHCGQEYGIHCSVLPPEGPEMGLRPVPMILYAFRRKRERDRSGSLKKNKGPVTGHKT